MQYLLIYSTAASLVCLLTLFQPVSSDVVVKVKMVTYTNAEHRLEDKKCCKQSSGSESCKRVSPEPCQTCSHNCDNKFTIHTVLYNNVTGKPVSGYNHETHTTKVIAGGDNITFEDHLLSIKGQGIKIKNPLFFEHKFYRGAFMYEVDVNDKDTDTTLEKVSSFQRNITDLPAKDEFSAKEKHLTLFGKTNNDTVLNVTYWVYCKRGYLKPHCEEYCIDTDSDKGHYTCDYDTGKKKCKPDYFDVMQNCLSFCHPVNNNTHRWECSEEEGGRKCGECHTGTWCDQKIPNCPTTPKPVPTTLKPTDKPTEKATDPPTEKPSTKIPTEATQPQPDAQKAPPKGTSTEEVLLPILFIAAAVGSGLAYYYMVMRKKRKRNEVAPEGLDLE